MKIEVVKYNIKWADDYEEERISIEKILQDELIKIYHIGSTSVIGLQAKPIIDILLAVENINKLDSYSEKFNGIGYDVMGEFGIAERRYFRKGGDDRTHQIHAFEYTNLQEIERHLIFRDYLRQNPIDCKAYGEIKARLAEEFPDDIDSYGDGKEDFVREIKKKALKWHLKKR